MIDLSIGNPDMPPADFVRETMVHTAIEKRATGIHYPVFKNFTKL